MSNNTTNGNDSRVENKNPIPQKSLVEFIIRTSIIDSIQRFSRHKKGFKDDALDLRKLVYHHDNLSYICDEVAKTVSPLEKNFSQFYNASTFIKGANLEQSLSGMYQTGICKALKSDLFSLFLNVARYDADFSEDWVSDTSSKKYKYVDEKLNSVIEDLDSALKIQIGFTASISGAAAKMVDFLSTINFLEKLKSQGGDFVMNPNNKKV